MLLPKSFLHLAPVGLILLAITFYTLIYLSPHSPKHIIPGLKGSQRTSTGGKPSLGLKLDPVNHIFRSAQTIHHVWNITSNIRWPDGVKKRVYLINGEFPGPLIEARSEDEIVVEVNNYLDDNDGIAIHWHGLSMRGANNMDGVVGLTQRAILPSETFTYKFKIQSDESGTFWYHGHSDLQRADGLFGPLVVHKPVNSLEESKFAESFDEDLVLMVGDWYHRSGQNIQNSYTDWTNFGNEPAPDSMLVNGNGLFNCSMATPARPVECRYVGVPRQQMHAGRSRLRIINVGTLAGFKLSLTGFVMQLLEVDGGNPVSGSPWTESVGILYPGERMDLLVSGQNHGETENRLTISLDRENLKFRNFALTPTQHFSISVSSSLKTKGSFEGEITRFFNLHDAHGVQVSGNIIATKTEKTFLLYTKISMLSIYSNIPKGFINRTSWEPNTKSMPLLDTDRNKWGDAFVPWTGLGKNPWIDIVVNNLDDRGHPFHLHGNSFYVLANYGAQLHTFNVYNPFDASKDPAGGVINTLNPVKKDTIFVPRMGYVVLRFKADNEGLWFFHCHILMHNAAGMAMAFQVGGNEHGFS